MKTVDRSYKNITKKNWIQHKKIEKNVPEKLKLCFLDVYYSNTEYFVHQGNMETIYLIINNGIVSALLFDLMEADAHRTAFKLFELFFKYTSNIQLILLAVLVGSQLNDDIVNGLHFAPDDLTMYLVFLFYVLVIKGKKNECNLVKLQILWEEITKAISIFWIEQFFANLISNYAH